MFCDECGHQLDSNGVCPVCGATKAFSQPNTGQQNQVNCNPYMQQNMWQGTPQQGMPQQGMPQQGMPQQGMPQQGMPQQGMPWQSMSQQNQTYNSSYMQQGMWQGMPQQGMPQQGQVNNQPYGQAPYENMHLTYTPPKPKKKRWPIILGISLGIIAIAVAIILFIRLNDDDDDNDKKTTERTTERTTETTTEITTTETPIVYENGTRTIMIYMVGADLESKHGCATRDIDEMLNSGYDQSKTNIVIYTGGCTAWENPTIPDDENAFLLVDNYGLTLLDTEQPRNMGDSATLANFLNYGYTNYPAEQYDLILWNHGGGAFFGYGYDERTSDSLTLQEISDALAASPFHDGNKLEWIGFDACLMATIEVADAISPYAKYLVASQEPEPGWGWDYSFLGDISDAWDGAAAGQLIADNFIDETSYMFSVTPFSYSDITMSVMDLDKVDEVEDALNNLFSQVTLDDASYPKYSRIRSKTKEIASDFTGEQSYDVIDLMSYAKNLEQLHYPEAKALQNAIDELVVYSSANEANANGVSIYHPYNAKQYSTYLVPMYYTFGFAEEYAKYIAGFSTKLNSDTTTTASWDASTMLPYLTGSNRDFALQLNQEQADAYQNAYYVISRQDTEQPENYVFVEMSNDITYDGASELTAHFNGDIIYIQNDTTGEYYEVMYTVQEATEEYTRYLLTTILFNDSIDGDDAMYAYFVLETTPSDPSGHILGAYPLTNYIETEGAELFPDRYEIDINDYQNIAFGCASHKFTSTEDLTNFNQNDWSDVTLWYNSFPISDGFSTRMETMIPDIPYYGMFIIEDVQGIRHCSNIVQIQ